MTDMNGKIFVHNDTGNRYFVLNKAVDMDSIKYADDLIIYVQIDSNDENWYAMSAYDFFDIFTEQV